MRRRIVSLFRNLLRKREAEQALDEELRSSLDILTKEKIQEGLSPAEARRDALMELGGVEQVKEGVRGVRAGRLLEDFARDVRFAMRSFARSPGLAAVIVISVALSIAANATVFSIANGLLWGSLPVNDPGRMVMFSEGKSFSYPDYVDYSDGTAGVFEGGVMAHFAIVPASIGGTGEPERVWGQVVSGNYFSVLGIKMALGRPILPEEDKVLGRDRVAVLSYRLWQRRFGGDPGILERGVVLNGQRYAAVGVAPPGFQGSERGIVSDFWAPLAMVDEIIPNLATAGGGRSARDDQWLMLNARLKPGISRAAAQAAVNVIAKRLDATYRPNEKRQDAVTLEAGGGLIGGSVTPAYGLMAVLMLAVGMLLVTACANVANLLLARAAARQREIGIRLAIGAGRGRLIRQLLTESLILALAGSFAGFALAAVAAKAVSKFRLPIPLPVVFDFNVDLRVAAFTVGLSIVTALLFGLVPALRATRRDLVDALKNGGGTGAGRSLTRNALVVMQVAFSLTLLTAAGLFVRSLGNASSIDIGFKPDHMLVMAVDPKVHNYSREKTGQFLRQLQERVSGLPGVRSVSFVDSVPLSIAAYSRGFEADGAGGGAKRGVSANVYGVYSAYFQTMGIPMLRGRDFSAEGDNRNAIIINETMASRLFPNQDPIGRVIRAAPNSYTVIGLARNSKSRTVGERPVNCAYLYIATAPPTASFTGISALVKTFGEPNQLARPVREQITELDPNLAVFNTETMQDHVYKSLLLPRISALLLGIFGGIGLTLGAIGLYGVMSYTVRRRTHEIGIRMALGAQPAGVLAIFMRQGLLLTATGLGIGLAGAWAIGRLSASLLYGVSPTDPLTFVAVPSVLAGAALLAIWVPARRATQVDPLIALRNE